VDLADLATKSGEWLRGAGPETDVVMSSRIRLARNVAGFPFATKATEEQKAEVLGRVKAAVEAVALGDKRWFVDVGASSGLETRFLVERHLISRELAMGKGSRGVAFGADERMSVMVNEEDHVRLQTMRSGLSLDQAWDDALKADVALERGLTYAVSPTYGYLTACPTNVGTGLRASVMLHLPALVYAKQIDKVFQAASRTGLAVRGFYGEGTMASGDFYQISNQVTLGVSEEDILRNLRRMLPNILAYEREVRQHLLSNRRVRLEDKVHRALALLRSARVVASEEAMELLSAVRMGVVLGILGAPAIETVNDLFVLTQPAHLQKITGQELDADDRDVHRANLLRKRLSA
jgi:protein arginine kinase